MKRNTFIRMVTVVNLINLLLFVNYLGLSLEKLDRDQRSSLLRTIVNYDRKMFCNIDTRAMTGTWTIATIISATFANRYSSQIGKPWKPN
jgi:hypothetical protein